MPSNSAPPRPACHWEDIQGARVRGRVISHKIWVCEYPYRTMRRHVPSAAECHDCPVRQQMQADENREAAVAEEEFIVRSGF